MRFVALAVFIGVLWASPVHAQDFYPKETESFLINYYAFSRSPTTAYLLSAAPGFGLGHFYAGQFTRGLIMAIGEAIGLGLALMAPHVGESGDTARGVLLYSGLLVFGGFKVVDMYLAPDSVEIHNKKVAKRLKIRALVVEDEGRPGQPQVAYGLALEGPMGW